MTMTLQPTAQTANRPTFHPTLHPTEQAVRLHRSHLATTHRAPLVTRSSAGPRARATSFMPMAPAFANTDHQL
jgi:hypothetical protein